MPQERPSYCFFNHCNNPHILVTWLDTVERNSVLSDEPITNEVIILYNEPHQSQIREIDVKLEGFVKDWVITWRKKKQSGKEVEKLL